VAAIKDGIDDIPILVDLARQPVREFSPPSVAQFAKELLKLLIGRSVWLEYQLDTRHAPIPVEHDENLI
jgi:hypothetical protein